MAPPPSKRPVPPEGYQAGDDDCRSCVGIAYLTQAMREKGQKPECIGIKKTLKARIPLDQLEALNKQTNLQDLGVFINIGYSRWSGMMERTGRAPISINGIQMHFARRIIPKTGSSATTETPATAVPTPSTTPSRSLTIPNAQDISLHAAAASAAATKYLKLLKKGVTKQWEGLRKNWTLTKQFVYTTAKGFPTKIAKSSTALAKSIDKTARKAYGKAAALWKDF